MIETSSFFLKVSTFHKESFYAIPSTLRSLFTAETAKKTCQFTAKTAKNVSKIVNKLCQAISQLKNMIETSSFFLKVSTFHKESFYAIPSTLRSLFTAETAKKRDVTPPLILKEEEI